MKSKCLRRRVCHSDIFTTFSVFCDLYMEYICFKQRREKKNDIHILASYCLTVLGFELVQAFFNNATFRLGFFFYFLSYFYTVFPKSFFNTFTRSNQINRENISQICESLIAMTHGGNCCEDFLQFRHSKVVKNSFCLQVSIFLLCKQLLLKLFGGVHLLNSK